MEIRSFHIRRAKLFRRRSGFIARDESRLLRATYCGAPLRSFVFSPARIGGSLGRVTLTRHLASGALVRLIPCQRCFDLLWMERRSAVYGDLALADPRTFLHRR
jgi:hypothetical protein